MRSNVLRCGRRVGIVNCGDSYATRRRIRSYLCIDPLYTLSPTDYGSLFCRVLRGVVCLIGLLMGL